MRPLRELQLREGAPGHDAVHGGVDALDRDVFVLLFRALLGGVVVVAVVAVAVVSAVAGRRRRLFFFGSSSGMLLLVRCLVFVAFLGGVSCCFPSGYFMFNMLILALTSIFFSPFYFIFFSLLLNFSTFF